MPKEVKSKLTKFLDTEIVTISGRRQPLKGLPGATYFESTTITVRDALFMLPIISAIGWVIVTGSNR